MKIAVMNYSGNVGKTTIARDLLGFRMQDHKIISVESINADGRESIQIKGAEGSRLFFEILTEDNLIIDVGSSNIENFFQSGKKEAEIISNIDLFIIPTTSDQKQQHDTLKTCIELYKSEVDSKNIIIIFNTIPDDSEESLESLFGILTKGVSELGIDISFDNIIYRHDLYESGKNLADIISDEDYKSKMTEAKMLGDEKEAKILAWKYIEQRKAQSLNSTYQKIFENIVGNRL